MGAIIIFFLIITITWTGRILYHERADANIQVASGVGPHMEVLVRGYITLVDSVENLLYCATESVIRSVIESCGVGRTIGSKRRLVAVAPCVPRDRARKFQKDLGVRINHTGPGAALLALCVVKGRCSYKCAASCFGSLAAT